MAVAIKTKARDIPQLRRSRFGRAADAHALERRDRGVGAYFVLLEQLVVVGKAALKLAGEAPHELQDDDAVTHHQAVEVAAVTVPSLGDAAGEAE